jgi:enoyl-[acyl-carrier-protein] reductase (NADH)
LAGEEQVRVLHTELQLKILVNAVSSGRMKTLNAAKSCGGQSLDYSKMNEEKEMLHM